MMSDLDIGEPVNVSLTPELEAWVHERVRSGRYASSSEVVRAALRMLVEDEELRALRKEELLRLLRVGAAELDAGLGVELTDGLVDDVVREGRRRLGVARE